MNAPNFPILFGAWVFAFIPGTVFWPYFAGVALFAIGIFRYGREALRAHGIDKMVTLGPLFFAIPMAVFASQHFTEAKFVATVVPSWLPGHLFWTYFIGAAIIAASLGIVAKIQAWLAALLLAVLLILFVLLLHIPSILATPKIVTAWTPAFRDLSFAAGALAFAATQIGERKAVSANILVTFARVFIAVSAIFFAVEHFRHPHFMPAVDFDRTMPAWVPLRVFWSYFAGTVFLVTGATLILNRRTRLAATCLGFMLLLLVLFVYLPILASSPLDIDNGLNFFVSTLAFGGAALLIAKAMPADVRIKD